MKCKKYCPCTQSKCDGCDTCKELNIVRRELKISEDENKGLKQELEQIKQYPIHESWLTKSKEEILSALKFQGAMTKDLDRRWVECLMVVSELWKVAYVGEGKIVCPKAFAKAVKMAGDIINSDGKSRRGTSGKTNDS